MNAMIRFTLIILIIIMSIFDFSSCRKGYDLLHSKSKWMKDYFDEIQSGKYPNIYAVSWWHEDFDKTYLTINSSGRSRKTYRELVSNNSFISDCSFTGKKLQSVAGKFYHSAFPGFGGTEDMVSVESIDQFEQLAGKAIAWAYFSNNWSDSLIFPANAVNIIKNKHKIPFIRLMYRSVFEEGQDDPKYKMMDIVNGRYDVAITSWAEEARTCGTNLLAEFGTEVNGKWFSWNGSYYGAGVTGGYGDPNYPDGPEIFRDAYRHIISLCNQQGADNITWFFHFDVNNDPDEWWNSPEYYYPGDNYIDWIGVSTYGPCERGDDYVNPSELIKKAYEEMKNVSVTKPYSILEFGVTEL